MPHYIVKLETPKGPRYLDWSTVVDAPVTYGMTLDAFKAWYRDEHGEQGMRTLPARLARVEANGTSDMTPTSAADLLSCNRAGEKEARLTVAEIIAKYCDEAP